MNHHSSRLLRRPTGAVWGDRSRCRLSVSVKPVGAIVFVHGFRGSAIDTWLQFPFSLPREPKVAAYDLLYYGYDTRQQAAFSATKLQEFIFAVADDPAADLVNPSLERDAEHRDPAFRYDHIVIAAHSLGAVVSRLALLDSVDEHGQPLPWLSKVRLALFAPAHLGAQAVNLASMLLLGFRAGPPLEAFARKRYKSIKDLDDGSLVLRRVYDETGTLLQDGTKSLVECHCAWVAHGGKDWVVTQDKFHNDRGLDKRMPFETWDDLDHFQVCKPTWKESRPLDFLLTVIP